MNFSLYSEHGISYYDKMCCFREQFKSLKNANPDHKDRAQGSIDNSVRIAIINAINGHYQISIYYMGDKQNSPGWRTVQPYVYGLVKGTGNEVIRAYQITGGSVSHHFPMWRLFRLDRIGNITSNTTQVFDKAKPLYNFFWDRGMTARFVWWRKNKDANPIKLPSWLDKIVNK